MEKFGIFELLDALSALSDSNLPKSPSQNQPTSTPPVPSKPQHTPSHEQNVAVTNFLLRHDAIAKRADKQKQK